MTREAFRTIASDAVATVTATAEQRLHRQLSRTYVWGPKDRRTGVALKTSSIF